MSKMYWAEALIGGATGALDAIDGADLGDGDAAIVFVNSTGLIYMYILDGTSGATEASPDIISPDTNAGTKRWLISKKINECINTGKSVAMAMVFG